jgi:hypothetical protein
MRTLLLAATLLALPALADDRAACAAGDNRACARIGELKQQGALSPNATKDVDKLAAACGKALEAATAPASFSQVSSACNQLFNAELELGAERAGPLAAKFDAAWDKFLGPAK